MNGGKMDAADTDADSGELGRLRRQLRAQSAVNRQLHAQLDGGSVRVASSRGAGSEGTASDPEPPSTSPKAARGSSNSRCTGAASRSSCRRRRRARMPSTARCGAR